MCSFHSCSLFQGQRAYTHVCELPSRALGMRCVLSAGFLWTRSLWSLHCASHEARCRWRELFMFSHGAQCRWEAHMSPRVVASQRCGAPIPSNVCLVYELLCLCVATAPRGCVKVSALTRCETS